MTRRGQQPPVPTPRRTARLRVWCTPDELEAVRQRARVCRRTVARYVREVVLGSVPRESRAAVNADAIRELARVGTNLNQLARAANSEGNFPLEARILAVLEHVMATVDRLA